MHLKPLLLALAASAFASSAVAMPSPAGRAGPIPLDKVPMSSLSSKVPPASARLQARDPAGRAGPIPLDKIPMSSLSSKVPSAHLHEARTAAGRPGPIPLDSQRGSIPDITDLSRDIVAREPHPSTLSPRQTNLNTAADNLVFTATLASFLSSKAAQSPAGLDWTDDGCSTSPDKPWGFNFLDSCRRHDFGYRNFKAQGRFTDANRLRIDDVFKRDLGAECAKSTGSKKELCDGTAGTYYQAVRLFGGL